MALIGPMNQRDPRFQEALLRGAAGGPKNMLGLSKFITSQHVGREMDTRLRFAQLAQQQRAFRDKLKLAKKGQRFNYKMGKQSLKDRRQDLNRTMGLGLLTAGFGFLEGRRRASLREEDRAMRKKYYDSYEKKYITNTTNQMPDWGAGRHSGE
jgi:hypothetical protein